MNTSESISCPFCLATLEIVAESANGRVFAIRDRYPVARGHTLIIPRRHVSGWFEASREEQAAILELLEVVKHDLESEEGPLDFNIGVNVGAAAGQTVSHLHVHLVPRRPGDVPDPRGGVRHVIPGRGNYLSDSPANALVSGDPEPFLPYLLRHFDDAVRVDVAVAFVLSSGLRLIEAHVRDLLERGGELRLVTGDYLDVTDPIALRRLLDLQSPHPARFDVRIFETRQQSFHPKSFVFHLPGDEGIAYVGSSNLSEPALTTGVEWNYRVVHSKDVEGFRSVTASFEALRSHSATAAVTDEWIDQYELRRRPPPPSRPVEVASDPPTAPPRPHEVQEAALEALASTRAEGHAAGLVVLATGLGKTWLAAFDSVQAGAKRTLFVAHREEILEQALATFRQIRPDGRLGLFTGQRKVPDAQVLFASVQTLSREEHLRSFAADRFDYIVIDEFHHAAARTYRQLIDYFEPGFMLGLTATPERTDGADLLALCGGNLVYRCDALDGIEQGLLSAFRYYGVPDNVDYENIPWRSNRFDQDALEQALATSHRADNALQQYRDRAGARTLAFCATTAHSDFMRDHFAGAGVRAASVHSGTTSDPRATSLQRLDAGDLEVVFSVDVFNEGVDVPQVDTVMMLRPTESRVIWLQQFGRGLRNAPGKDYLTVIDYIGNHRAFLLKAQALFQIPRGDARIRELLDRYERGELDLPEGCEVTYDLEVLSTLRGLLRTAAKDELAAWYRDFHHEHGRRPLATEAFYEGWNPRSARVGYGSWLGFVQERGGLDEAESALLEHPSAGSFLTELETTAMTRSYKMVVLLATMRAGRLPGSIALEELTHEVAQLARRIDGLREDFSVDIEDSAALRRLLVRNPVAALAGAGGPGPGFEYSDGMLRTSFDVEGRSREALVALTREIAEWRLFDYLAREARAQHADMRFTAKLSQTGGRPILFLDRGRQPRTPSGWTTVEVAGQRYEANFVQVALNVMKVPGEDDNVLPRILRELFGAAAGQPGTRHFVEFVRSDGVWVMSRLEAPTRTDQSRSLSDDET